MALRMVLGELLCLSSEPPEGPLLVIIRLLFLDPFERAAAALVLLSLSAVVEVATRWLD